MEYAALVTGPAAPGWVSAVSEVSLWMDCTIAGVAPLIQSESPMRTSVLNCVPVPVMVLDLAVVVTVPLPGTDFASGVFGSKRSEERRVGKECRAGWVRGHRLK